MSVDKFAFPNTIPPGCREGSDVAHGLTKREFFAVMALQGLVQDPNMESTERAVQGAVEMADALIAELEKTPRRSGS